MNDVDDVMTNIYNTLLQLRYPHITKAESKDVGPVILSGENRIYLLSWLLTEKSPSIIPQLEKLRDAALEDQLFECYSQIGICNKKDVLLGKCSLKEQLPALRLLLNFMRKVHLEHYVSTNKTEEIPMDIAKLYIDDAKQISSLPAVKPKLGYTEATKYFEEIERYLSSNDHEDKSKIDLSEDLTIETDNQLANEEQGALFNKEEEKFVEAFQSVSSWPIQSRNLDEDTANSISSDIKNICADFLILKKVLQAKDEISKVNLARGLPKITTPLNAIIEDIIICNEEIENLSVLNDSTD